MSELNHLRQRLVDELLAAARLGDVRARGGARRDHRGRDRERSSSRVSTRAVSRPDGRETAVRSQRRGLPSRGRARGRGRRRDGDRIRPVPAASRAAGGACSCACRGARRPRRDASAPHADHRSARGSSRARQVARARAADAVRAPRARRRAVARGSRRDGRLRRELLQSAHRGRAVPAWCAPHRALDRAHDDGARRSRGAVGRRADSTSSSTVAPKA